MSESSPSTGSRRVRKPAKKSASVATSRAHGKAVKASSSMARGKTVAKSSALKTRGKSMKQSPDPRASQAQGKPVKKSSATEASQALGRRVTRYREDRGLSLTELAKQSELSKSYLSAIEAGEVPRPSGESLYALAKPLGVTMSDLLGRKLLTQDQPDTPASLREFAAEQRLPLADVRMLAAIQFRGGAPQTKERWAMIYSAIRQSEWMDQDRA